jgi:hypothetical protein
MEGRRRGRVTATYMVWCNDCDATCTAPANVSRKVAESHWMGFGWCRFRGHWTCPTCVPARAKKNRKDLGYDQETCP